MAELQPQTQNKPQKTMNKSGKTKNAQKFREKVVNSPEFTMEINTELHFYVKTIKKMATAERCRG